MKIALGSDHAGFSLKEIIKHELKKNNYEIIDCGTHNEDAVDYPDFAQKVAQQVSNKFADRGIMLCGSGVGASIAANKIHGIRASVCHDTYSAHQGVEHDDMNILVLGARVVGQSLALEIISRFLKANFTNEERHVRRLEKIKALEN